MDTPSSFIPHEHSLVSVEECLGLWSHFSCLYGFDWL